MHFIWTDMYILVGAHHHSRSHRVTGCSRRFDPDGQLCDRCLCCMWMFSKNRFGCCHLGRTLLSAGSLGCRQALDMNKI